MQNWNRLEFQTRSCIMHASGQVHFILYKNKQFQSRTRLTDTALLASFFLFCEFVTKVWDKCLRLVCLSASNNSTTAEQAVMQFYTENLHECLLTISNVGYNRTKITDTGELPIIVRSLNATSSSTEANKYGGRLEIQVSQCTWMYNE